jgi:2',3'-cyclic-nucleotide 2'-phosphodiesterase (5'-nucleotidase family)
VPVPLHLVIMTRHPLFIPVVLVGFLCLGCNKPMYIQRHASTTYQVSKSADQDSNIIAMLKPYKAGVDTQMQIIIGHTDMPLTKAQPECTLGNFMTDAQLEAAKRIDGKVVASIMNYGGIRTNYIAPGLITKGKLYELMPFDNMLTIVEVPGEILKTFCDHMAKYRGWPVSGISYIIKDGKATDVTINGSVVNDNIIYKVALNDYIAKGGDNCDFLIRLPKRYTNIFIRDILIEYVSKHEKQGIALHPKLENRVKYAE